MDSATYHLDPVIAAEAFREAKTDTKYIDAEMKPLYQFLDTHINKPFKDRGENGLIMANKSTLSAVDY